jgi:hypothetical protein
VPDDPEMIQLNQAIDPFYLPDILSFRSQCFIKRG